MNKRQALVTLSTAMLISILGTVGIALPYPVLAPYFLDIPANNLNHFLGLNPKLLLGTGPDHTLSYKRSIYHCFDHDLV